jgi:predicted DCC family thiol-disulfide oxidoreductase YuxK
MGMIHLFTFDPAWIKGEKAEGRETLFYDGSCGLCHSAVRFVLAEESACNGLRFAPLGGAAFQAGLSESARANLPDSLVLRTAEGAILTRSTAVIGILKRLGGLWRVIGLLGGVIPRPLRDLAYDGVAGVRYRLFGRASEACPLLPPALRSRFDP